MASAIPAKNCALSAAAPSSGESTVRGAENGKAMRKGCGVNDRRIAGAACAGAGGTEGD